jgi:hypothetical protein
MMGTETRLRQGRGNWLCLLIVTTLLSLPPESSAVTITSHGPRPNDIARREPIGLTPLIQSPHRVGSVDGPGGAAYFYRCGAAGLDSLLEAFAKVDMALNEVVIWPSLEEFKNTEGMALDDPPAVYNAVLTHPDVFLRLFGENETFYPVRPRLTIYVSDYRELEELRFPPQLVLVHPAQRLDFITQAIKMNAQRYRAVRYLRDLGPDAKPLQADLERLLNDENEYVVEACRIALEQLQPDEAFRKISDRIMEILKERELKQNVPSAQSTATGKPN